jgi:hypothetical protein
VLKITPNQWVSRTLSYIKNELLPAQWAENRVVIPGKIHFAPVLAREMCMCMKTRGGPQAMELNFPEKFISTHFLLNLRQSFKCYHSRNDLAAGFLKFNIAP